MLTTAKSAKCTRAFMKRLANEATPVRILLRDVGESPPGFSGMHIMKTRGWGIGLLLVAAGFGMAGEEPTHEQVIQKMIGSLNEISKILKSIEPEDTAKKARSELRKAATNWIEARAKAAKMQPPERQEKERLAKIYKPKIDEALKKLFVEMGRVEVIPGGKEALKEISEILK